MKWVLWEQEAASSSLATPILQTHVDSIRTNVRFVLPVNLPERVQKPHTLQGRFQKAE